MWKANCVITEGIIGASDKVTEVVKKTLGATPGKHTTGSMQKTAELGTAHVVRKGLHCRGRVSSVGIATRYGLDGPGIESRWGRDFPHPSRPTLGPTQQPVQWVPGFYWG